LNCSPAGPAHSGIEACPVWLDLMVRMPRS